MLNDYKDKTIWIVGASTGIGAALAENLSDKGAQIILSARDGKKLESVKAAMKGFGHRILPMDVGNRDEVLKSCDTAFENNQKIDSIIFLAASF